MIKSPFKLSAMTMALVGAGFSSVAYANEPAAENAVADNVEVLEVRGIRRSMAEAQAVKMEETSIVEAISAEDIGKLPDVSIAESLARLPGLAAQRLDGRANVVSIRGLAPDFTTATLNGREQVTISDNRGVEFDHFPSELINGVVVYKTPDASVTAQAIGGTIDMQTIRPLAYGEQTIVVNARGEYNDLGKLNSDGEEYGYRASISYVDQFFDDTLGIALGYAKMSSPNQEERWNAWGYPEDGTTGDLELGGAKPFVRSSLLERDGYMGVIEFAPNDKFTSTIDAFYSDFQDEQLLRGIEIPAAWGTGVDPVVSENGLVTQGLIPNAKVVVRNDVNRREAQTFSWGWNNKLALTEQLTVELDLSYSHIDRVDFGLESYSGTGRSGVGATDNIGYQLTADGSAVFSPTLDYSDYDLIRLGGPLCWGNPQGPCSQDGFINRPDVEDELSAIRLSAEHLFDEGAISSIELGLNYSNREKQKINEGFFLTLNSYDADNPQADLSVVPEQYRLGTVNLGFIGMGNMIAYDSMALFNDGFYSLVSENETDPTRSTNSWLVNEDVATLFFKANIDSELSGMALKGNFGVQFVHTDQSSDGLEVEVAQNGQVLVNPVTDGDDFIEWLPSGNIGLELVDDMWLRFATARTMVRPRMDQMNSSFVINFDNSKNSNEVSDDFNASPWSADLGNAKLRPYIAWQYDLSWEYYLEENGYLSAALFYKDISDFIYKESFAGNFSEYADPSFTEWTSGTYNQWQNGDGGHIQGIELSAHLSGGLLSDSLSGFGVILSSAFNDSAIKETSDAEEIEMPGLSKTVVNGTFYYEDYGFSARISARYRDDFLGEVTGLSLRREFHYVAAETVVDAQIGYDFSEAGIAGLEGLNVFLQATNLTDEPFTTYTNEDKRQVRDYQVYGTNYMLGLSYTF
ncbi:TonB-dependent receptor [Ferrimonas senticii]|uniref:TonB-dependent receptor n=1 Tax=Ferrimonas senticii TaxID=394566 RepID=UPI000428B6CC|nr:TonB-dependent receptor [Ferrimonas senticii]